MTDILQRKSNNNHLIVKDIIGKPKNLGYNLPEGIIFGKKSYGENKLSVKEAINDWQITTPTDRSKRTSDYVMMNIIQAQKHIQLKDIQEFRQKNQIAKEKKIGSNDVKINLPDDNFIYGKPNWQDQNMKKIMTQEYKNQADLELEQYYQEFDQKKREEQFQKNQKRTKSIAVQNQKQQITQIEKQPFKMQKFTSIESKYKNDDRINWSEILKIKN